MFENLPRDTKLTIFSFLNSKEKAKFSHVSKEWQGLLNNEMLWKLEVERFFMNKDSIPKISTFYKSAYLQCVNVTNQIIHKVYKQLNKPLERDNTCSKYRMFVIAIEDMSTRFFETNLFKSFNIPNVRRDELIYQFLKRYNVNQTYDHYGFTLLHLAIAAGSVQAVRYLLDHPDIDLSIKTKIVEHTAEELTDLLIKQDLKYKLINIDKIQDNLKAIKQLFIQMKIPEQILPNEKKRKL